MKSPRIPVAWILLLAVLAILGFFGYHILQVSSGANQSQMGFEQRSRHVTFSDAADRLEPQYHAEMPLPHKAPRYLTENPEGAESEEDSMPAPAVPRPPPAAKPMPRVPGQTETDLRAHEPLQASPPPTLYGPPEATDPMNRVVHAESEFGSNFRHPEQFMESRPPSTVAHMTQSGLGAEVSSPGGNNAQGYSPEMIQNSGEFMKGIFAFDTSDSGVGYSML